jgi:hypothetical protein
LQKLGSFFIPKPQTITDHVGTTTQLATIPVEDPKDQSGREDTLNVLIDGFDADFLYDTGFCIPSCSSQERTNSRTKEDWSHEHHV